MEVYWNIGAKRIEMLSLAFDQNAEKKTITTRGNSVLNRKYSLQRETLGKFFFIKDGGKEEKNIKRRIYDALNVMIAAGLLEKEEAYIDIKKKKSSTVFIET